MLSLPNNLTQQFSAFLLKEGCVGQNRAICLKWLRFYWDFCDKYHYDPHYQESLPLFLDKLQQDNQSARERTQAESAIKLFYRLQAESELCRSVTEIQVAGRLSYADAESLSEPCKIDSPEHPNTDSSPKQSGSSWEYVFATLESEIKRRQYAPKTLKIYRCWTRHLQIFTHGKNYQALEQQDGVAFLSYLAADKHVSASSWKQAFNALQFLFKNVLYKELGNIEGVVRAKCHSAIPLVLSRAEIELIFDHLKAPVDLIAKLLYGCGLRLFECLNLRVHCFDFDTGLLSVYDGKGNKDRTVPIPQVLMPSLKQQLQKVAILFAADLDAKFDGTFLPEEWQRTDPNAAKEFIQQWFFPAQSLTLSTATHEHRRYHVHESVVQKAIKRAVHDAGLTQRASAQTFRHSFACHLLQANYDIRTIQALMGHRNLKTTMIYTHAVPCQTITKVKSPLDF